MLHCKREVEEEEAMALAQVQSLVEEYQPRPPISLVPPTETVIIHVQPDNVSTLHIIHTVVVPMLKFSL